MSGVWLGLLFALASVPAPTLAGSVPTETSVKDSSSDAGMVSIGTFDIDRYEFPNQLGVIPRVNVSWREAEALCAARGKRLCTESEWQRAAAGSTGVRFGYGSEFDETRCNTPYRIHGKWHRDRGIAPSGAFTGCCGDFGVYDMIGNVWEWVADTTAARPGWRIVRGGSWFNSVNLATVDSRYSRFLTPDYRLDLIGFRCCRTHGTRAPARAP